MITFVRNRISPLQKRTHKLCHMSWRLDPNRTSSFELSKTEIFRRVKALFTTNKKFTADWEWGIEHFCRDRLPPAVNLVLQSFSELSLMSEFIVCLNPSHFLS